MSEACKTCRSAIIEYLEAVGIAEQKLKVELANQDLSTSDQTQTVEPGKLFWEKKRGSKGEFEQTSEKTNQNSDAWKALVAKLKEHHGFWQDSSFKYWFHVKNEAVVDRRES